MRQIKEPYASRLMGKSIGISIIPTDARLTELPYWNSLAGLPTADGRPGGYDAVRGVADTAQPKVAVGAETLGAGDIGDPTSPGYALTHELGHLVLMHTAGPEDMRVLADTARRTQIRAGGPFVGDDSYTKFNVDEYWAEGTAAHFTVFAKRSLSAEYSQTWLKTNDRNLWQLICNVYRGCAPA
ncbi:hypothetical protein ACFV30_37540 [Streptomyces sp. NPDC059752]|uniref:hypothetical protein n=1 Tax=unclassified Streptomyces TaxID=2593676 RepID=UPI00364B25FB